MMIFIDNSSLRLTIWLTPLSWTSLKQYRFYSTIKTINFATLWTWQPSLSPSFFQDVFWVFSIFFIQLHIFHTITKKIRCLNISMRHSFCHPFFSFLWPNELSFTYQHILMCYMCQFENDTSPSRLYISNLTW